MLLQIFISFFLLGNKEIFRKMHFNQDILCSAEEKFVQVWNYMKVCKSAFILGSLAWSEPKFDCPPLPLAPAGLRSYYGIWV